MDRNHYPGKFIVFEGLDGSGQSTQAVKLTEYLNRRAKKKRVFLTKEPTSNLIGGLIRSQLSHDWKSSSECLQLLFCADRAHHLEKEIEPMLKKGMTVICDRYFFSTIAYGSIAVDRKWLRALNDKFLLPDVTFLLKVSPRICIERMQQSRFGFELFEQKNVLKKVWAEYTRLAKEFRNTILIDGEKPIEDVFNEINNKIVDHLKK